MTPLPPSQQSNRYCSDHCREAAEAGRPSYAPCPIISPGPDDPTCERCGFYVPVASTGARP